MSIGTEQGAKHRVCGLAFNGRCRGISAAFFAGCDHRLGLQSPRALRSSEVLSLIIEMFMTPRQKVGPDTKTSLSRAQTQGKAVIETMGSNCIGGGPSE